MVVTPRAPERTAPSRPTKTPPPDGDDVAAQATLDAVHTGFDIVLQWEAECQREANALRDLALEQIKRDDELMKKWIELI